MGLLQSVVLSALLSSSAWAATFPQTAHSFKVKMKFQISVSSELDKATAEENKQILKKFDFEPLPVGVVRPFGIPYD